MEGVHDNWEPFKLNKQLLQGIADCGFSEPTEIQKRCIPAVSGGQQVIGIAQTGTGKTAAYLIPVLLKLRFQQDIGPRALILAPTKELVIQIAEHGRTLAAHTDLRLTSIYGGIGPKAQLEEIENGTDLIIATPGRFMELYLRGGIVSKHIQTLVIDEADRMMDMNFMPQLWKIFEVLPSKRQNLLFSATFSPRVDKMAQEFLDFPKKIEVTPQATVARMIRQFQIRVPNFKTKLNLLSHWLEDSSWSRVIIFTRTREAADNISKFLDRTGVGPVRAVHANKGQNARINAIKEFSEGQVRILVATDVAARGIDIEKVTQVINFDVPVVYDDYVHRIGRTGRASNTGDSYTMVCPSDEYHISKIEGIIKEKIGLLKMPVKVNVEQTPFPESQVMARAIDQQKRKENPEYQGAFHDRKRKKR